MKVVRGLAFHGMVFYALFLLALDFRESLPFNVWWLFAIGLAVLICFRMWEPKDVIYWFGFVDWRKRRRENIKRGFPPNL